MRKHSPSQPRARMAMASGHGQSEAAPEDASPKQESRLLQQSGSPLPLQTQPTPIDLYTRTCNRHEETQKKKQHTATAIQTNAATHGEIGGIDLPFFARSASA